MRGYAIPYEGADNLKSFEDAESQKAARLDAKADRFRQYAENAKKRAETLQSDFNRLRKDWAWLTQPNVNTSGGRAFANSRNKVMARYDRGMQEYQKAGNMAEYARQLEVSAQQTQLEDLGYLSNRLKENKKILNKFPEFEKFYKQKMEGKNLPDESLMWLDGQMNRYKLAFDKFEYYKYYYDLRREKLKENDQFFDEAAAKKTIKKDFKAFMLKHFDISVTSMSIAFSAKSGTYYLYRTDKPLPEMFHTGFASKNLGQMSVRQLYILMEKYQKIN
jgi:hypothetical protein